MSDFRQTLNLKESLRAKKELQPAQNIEKPEKISNKFALRLIFLIFLVGFCGAAYFFLFNHKQNSAEWMAVKLVNGEIYYGQIGNIKADPVAIENVYYNYDQQDGKPAPENGNLRLAKRGKETYGPDGSMSIFKTQILFIEPLSKDSKVLEAITSYESQK